MGFIQTGFCFFDEVYYKADENGMKDRACQIVIYTALVSSISSNLEDREFVEKVLDALDQSSIAKMMEKVYDTEFSMDAHPDIYKLLGCFAEGDIIKKMYSAAGKFGRTQQAKLAEL